MIVLEAKSPDFNYLMPVTLPEVMMASNSDESVAGLHCGSSGFIVGRALESLPEK